MLEFQPISKNDIIINEVIIMPREATRTATIYTRVDPETKEKAESILSQLGIPMSNAVGMFLKQIVLQNGIPFEMKLPAPDPVIIRSKDDIIVKLNEAEADIEAGNYSDAKDTFSKIRNKYNV